MGERSIESEEKEREGEEEEMKEGNSKLKTIFEDFWGFCAQKWLPLQQKIKIRASLHLPLYCISPITVYAYYWLSFAQLELNAFMKYTQ